MPGRRGRIALPPLHRALLFLFTLALTLYLFAHVSVRLSRERLGGGSLSIRITPTDAVQSANQQKSAGPLAAHKGNVMTSSDVSPGGSHALSEDLRAKKGGLLARLSSTNTQGQSDAHQAPYVVVMGNEAADTDSMASAILLTTLLDMEGNELAKRFPAGTTFVPLLQLPRKDLVLRAENQYLLELLGVDAESMLFLDDLPPLDALKRPDIFLGITDHPRLSGYWQPSDYFEERVQVVVDHHADDGAHTKAPLRELKGPEHGAVGSAVSVVVDLFKDSEQLNRIPAKLADLALAAVLIDTDDLKPVPQGKATPVDLDAANRLLQMSSLSSREHRIAFTQAAIQLYGSSSLAEQSSSSTPTEGVSGDARGAASQYYQILSAKKLDVSRLSSHDLLRRDYKENTVVLESHAKQVRAGFSSVPVGLSDWIHQRHGNDKQPWNAFWRTLRSWMHERSLDVAVVGTSFREVPTDQEAAVASERANGHDGNANEERAGDRRKHRRELVLAYLHHADGPKLFPSLVRSLEADSYAASLGNDASQQLELEAPWKGSRRVPSTGKRERVGGLDSKGRWEALQEAGVELHIAVWRQRNGRASRKVYLPAVMHALKAAAAAKAKA